MSSDRQSFLRHQLPNGLTIWEHPYDVPFAEIRVVIPVGNVHSHTDNPGGAPGIAHFLEHVCFERSALFPEKHSFERRLAASGADWNACTTAYYTDWYLQAPAATINELLPGFFSHVYEPIFSPEDIQLQVGIVSNERAQRKYYPSDNEMGQYQLSRWMNARYYDRDQLFGTPASLAELTAEQLTTFHQNYRTPGTNIFIGGTYDRTALMEIVSRITTSPTALVSHCEPAAWVQQTFHEFHSADTETPMYLWGGLATHSSQTDFWAISFLCDYLTDPNTGTLFTWTRKKMGWSYGLVPSYWHERDRLGFIIEFPLNDPAIVPALRSELHDRVRAAFADEAAVAAATKQAILSNCFNLQTLHDRLDGAVSELTSFADVATEAEYINWLQALTPATLKAAYDRYFAPEVSGELLILPK